MNDRPTLTEVIDKLKTVGSADQIALFLEEQEITGFQRRANSCVIAEYLKVQTGYDYATVDRDSATVGTATDCSRGHRMIDVAGEERYTGSEIDRFITNFDRGDYPNLVEGTVR